MPEVAAHKLRSIADEIERFEIWDGYKLVSNEREFLILESLVKPALAEAKAAVVRGPREAAGGVG